MSDIDEWRQMIRNSAANNPGHAPRIPTFGGVMRSIVSFKGALAVTSLVAGLAGVGVVYGLPSANAISSTSNGKADAGREEIGAQRAGHSNEQLTGPKVSATIENVAVEKASLKMPFAGAEPIPKSYRGTWHQLSCRNPVLEISDRSYAWLTRSPDGNVKHGKAEAAYFVKRIPSLSGQFMGAEAIVVTYSKHNPQVFFFEKSPQGGIVRQIGAGDAEITGSGLGISNLQYMPVADLVQCASQNQRVERSDGYLYNKTFGVPLSGAQIKNKLEECKTGVLAREPILKRFGLKEVWLENTDLAVHTVFQEVYMNGALRMEDRNIPSDYDSLKHIVFSFAHPSSTRGLDNPMYECKVDAYGQIEEISRRS